MGQRRIPSVVQLEALEATVRRGSMRKAAEELGVNSTSGAVVTRMQRASAAYDVGIRPGDVIVKFNNTAIEDPSQLYRLVADARIGSEATLGVLRNGRALGFKVPIVSDSRGRQSNQR